MLVAAPLALAAPDAAERASLRLSVADAPRAEAAFWRTQPEDEASLDLSNPAAPRFGEKGSWWGTVGGGAGFGADESSVDLNVFFNASHFLVDDFAINLELAGWFFDQTEGDDPFAANFNLTFQWHFINRDRWSLFAEAGAGLLLATDEVPDGGTEFNFTPRAGMGVTFRPGEGPLRVTIGARWQHISNARIDGAERNPGRDAGMIYAGVTFPF